jgi:eukaryotic-like serine/threonine-protein kinase
MPTIKRLFYALLLAAVFTTLFFRCKPQFEDLTPQVITGPAMAVGATSAVVGITMRGDGSLQEIGICYSTTFEMPILDGNSSRQISTSLSSTTVSLTELPPTTTYYYRAYGINHRGEINYGETKTFKTTESTLVVYAVSTDGKLYALDALNGMKLWEFNAGKFIDSSPTISNGILYVNSYDKKLYALNTKTGVKQWEFIANDNMRSPMIANGTLYVGSQGGKLYALDPATGNKRWEFATGGEIYGTPFVSNGTVYIGSVDKKLYAIDAVTGAKRWEFLADSSLEGSPTVADNVVYVGADSGLLYAIDAVTGTKRWQFSIRLRGLYAYPPSSPVVADGVVYISSDGTYSYTSVMFAIDAVTGIKRWEHSIGGYNFTSPVVENGVLYSGCPAQWGVIVTGQLGWFLALDAATGDERWTIYNRESFGRSVIANGIVFTGSQYPGNSRGELSAISAKTGKFRWAFPTKGNIYGSPLVTQNGVVVGTYPTDSGAGR